MFYAHEKSDYSSLIVMNFLIHEHKMCAKCFVFSFGKRVWILDKKNIDTPSLVFFEFWVHSNSIFYKYFYI